MNLEVQRFAQPLSVCSMALPYNNRVAYTHMNVNEQSVNKL